MPTRCAPLVLLALAAPAAALDLQEVLACDDGAEWPPFTHYLRDAQGKPSSELGGFSVEVLQQILGQAGIRLRLELLPWARCQREVESGRYLMALNASYSQERDARFWLTQPYYRTTHSYFFSRRHFPQGLPIAHLADLANQRVCGVRGYNYEAYKVPAEKIDFGARDFAAVVAKLHLGRCTIGLEKLEIVAGYRITGKDLLADPELGHAQVPELPPGEFHMMVSRQHPQGEALRDLLNRGLSTLRSSGQLQALQRRHLPGG
ncbi:substrate-binding periplasmic protein [Inhella sp.]|uniref:substrate-binding periplasmic protein n=1 Tax=Inhella sp. TaxID=1921806 RepID=UPI0035B0B90E